MSYEYKDVKTADCDTPYLLKFSTSVRNIGKVIKYESADNSFYYNINVSDLSVNEFKGIKTLSELMDTLRSISNNTDLQSSTYKTKLPSSFMMMAEYQVYKNCFVNLNYNYTYIKAGNDANTVLDFHSLNVTARYDRNTGELHYLLPLYKAVLSLVFQDDGNMLFLDLLTYLTCYSKMMGPSWLRTHMLCSKYLSIYKDNDKVKKKHFETPSPTAN